MDRIFVYVVFISLLLTDSIIFYLLGKTHGFRECANAIMKSIEKIFNCFEEMENDN